ncbi:hypothetical protein EHS39_11585 [Ensifer sp. MPMI2T]|nr:hypothetical protein EHS39_11585 [Ensifer sp. MPMI2T]
MRSDGVEAVGKVKNLTGARFGRLLIVGKSEHKDGRNTHWDYVCDCGNEGHSHTARLNAGQKSCGCHTLELTVQRVRTHGHTAGGASPTYRSYRAMIARVTYPSQEQWEHYGGRGIVICDRWLRGEDGRSGFECFLSDMGERPSGKTIDRLDVDGNYCPSNCEWATQKAQTRNMRSTRLTEDKAASIRLRRAEGASQNQLAAMFSVSRGTIRSILDGRSWI